MAERAKVTSIEALESFRSALVRYQNQAKRALDDVGGELKRTRDWLNFERRTFWQGQIKRAQRRMEQAEAELVTARFSAMKDDHSAQQLAVKKARRALDEVELRMQLTKRWIRDFDSVVAPAGRQLDGLHDRLAQEFPKAIAAIGRTIQVLQEYAQVKVAPRERSSPTPPIDDEEGGK